MARTISRGLSLVLEELELERPQLVTISQLAELCEKTNVRTPAKVVAWRLREKGWLLATSQRGVWEFAPAELAGPYSSADPLLSIKARVTTHPDERLALASQTAAWALGLADRVPAALDVTFERAPASIPGGVHASTYRPNIPIQKAKGVALKALISLVKNLIEYPTGEKWLEFKDSWYDAHAIGEYISSLSNAAALITSSPRSSLTTAKFPHASPSSKAAIRRLPYTRSESSETPACL